MAEDGRAAVEYWAIVTGADGEVITLAGVTVLRFDREGRVVEHRDHWSTREGARYPHSQPFGGDTSRTDHGFDRQ